MRFFYSKKKSSLLKKQRSDIMWDLLCFCNITSSHIHCTYSFSVSEYKRELLRDLIQIIIFFLYVPSTLFILLSWWQYSASVRGEWIWKLLWWANVYFKIGHFLFEILYICFIYDEKKISLMRWSDCFFFLMEWLIRV